MDVKPRCCDKVAQLIQKGVDIPNPLTLDLGDEVDVDRISGEGVRIYPGCRIYGKNTTVSAGAQIGYEGPAIQGLAPPVSGIGVLWLQQIVDGYCEEAQAILPSLQMFRK